MQKVGFYPVFYSSLSDNKMKNKSVNLHSFNGVLLFQSVVSNIKVLLGVELVHHELGVDVHNHVELVAPYCSCWGLMQPYQP